MSNAFEAIPGLKDLMPSEYGGTRGLYVFVWSKCANSTRVLYSVLKSFLRSYKGKDLSHQ